MLTGLRPSNATRREYPKMALQRGHRHCALRLIAAKSDRVRQIVRAQGSAGGTGARRALGVSSDDSPPWCYTRDMRLCAGRQVIALMCACALLPAAGSEGSHWLRVTSPNFELFTTASERSGRDVAMHFEQVRAFFLEAMGMGVNSGPPVRIVVFRSDKEFAPFAPNDFADAYYLGAQDRDYIVMKSASGERFPLAVHEYIHLLVKHAGIKAPVWFNEGLAELYSNLKPLGGKIAVGGIILPHLIILQQSKWIDLATLLAVGPDSALYNQKTHAGLFYAESWALVHMLYLSADYRPKLP